jgi:hypothetical protein
VIYVARNPKDAIVSFFYLHKLVNLFTFTGDLETFVDYFIDNKGSGSFIIVIFKFSQLIFYS